MPICSAGETFSFSWVWGGVRLQTLCDMWMDSKEPGQRHTITVNMHPLPPLEKRHSGKVQTAVIRVNMTVLSLLSSFPALPQPLQLPPCLLILSLSLSLSVSFNTPPPRCFFAPSIASSLPPTRSVSSLGDGCLRHLCSVSQMSPNTNWNINLAVDMAQEWWGGVKVLPSCCPQKVLWALPSIELSGSGCRDDRKPAGTKGKYQLKISRSKRDGNKLL